MKQGTLKVTIKRTYNRSENKTFEVKYECTLKELDKKIRTEFKLEDSHLSCFEVGNRIKHHYYSDKYLEESGHETKKHDPYISNDPFNNNYKEGGKFDKTLFQLYAKDGIWKFQYLYDFGDEQSFTIELREGGKQ